MNSNTTELELSAKYLKDMLSVAENVGVVILDRLLVTVLHFIPTALRATLMLNRI